MPIYEYEHTGPACSAGKVFEHEQAINAPPLTACPRCGRPVRRLISAPQISAPATGAELREKGFTKLVRRDRGVYENVTAREGKGRILNLGGEGSGQGSRSGRKKK